MTFFTHLKKITLKNPLINSKKSKEEPLPNYSTIDF